MDDGSKSSDHQAKLKKRAKKGDADAKAAKKQKKEEAKAAKKEAANGEWSHRIITYYFMADNWCLFKSKIYLNWFLLFLVNMWLRQQL